MCRTGAEDVHPRELLVQGPKELVHVDKGVRRVRRNGEWNAGLCTLLFDHLLEAVGKMVRVVHVHKPIPVRGHVALELESDKACETRGLIRSNEAAHCLGWDGSRPEIVVVVVRAIV